MSIYIVVGTPGHRDHIKELIESGRVAHAEGKDIEVVVVDEMPEPKQELKVWVDELKHTEPRFDPKRNDTWRKQNRWKFK